MERWLAAPPVARWWNEPFDDASVRFRYGARIDGTEPTRLYLIQLDGPIGLVQTYAWSDHSEHAGRLDAHPTEMGLDLAIGEVEHVGRGVGPCGVRWTRRRALPTATPAAWSTRLWKRTGRSRRG